jgi:tRNA threonylcarbamoyladenosine biosynthesis protein TsaE
MAESRPEERTIELDLNDERATVDLAAALAGVARVGDVIALSGELGAGKTVFARAFVRALSGGPGGDRREVPSPTFTLAQAYDCDAGTVHHFDFYRLSRPEEAWELGIEDAFADGISLVEWPERLGPELPVTRLEVTFFFADDPNARIARITARDDWRARLREAGID